MKPPKIFFLVSIAALFGLTGCVQITTQKSESNILLIDDFSSSKNGWNVWENSIGSAVSYYQGGLIFIINLPQYDYISIPKGSFTDTRIEVVANKLVGPDDNDYGIICRYQDEKKYYGFIISSDGYYGVVKVKDGNYQLLNSHNLEYSEIVRKGTEQNYLRADCVGNTLSLFVNDVKLAEVTDTDYFEGRVGLIAGSFSAPGVAVLFDNFMVLKP